jgi:hypothetical protein
MSVRGRLIDAILGLGLARRDPLLVLYRRQRLWRAPSRGAQLGIMIGKPWRALRQAGAFVREKGDGVRSLHGVGRIRQLATFSWLSLRHSVLPSSSAVQWAFAVKRPAKWNAWMSAPHCTLLLSELADRSDPQLRETISDKGTFSSWAAEHGLPAVPILARFADGAVDGRPAESVAAGLPPSDLFAKPTRLTWGVGAVRWLHAGPGMWTAEDGVPADARAIVARLLAASRRDPFILQRALRSHASLAPLAPHALCTLRCITFLDARGEPQLIGGALRLPVGRMIVDNVSSGGMFTGVDPHSGRLTRGFRVRPDRLFEPVTLGPDGVTPLAGFAVEQWPAARALALAAQRAAAPLPSIGWDIGLAEEGPVLIEANIGWSGLTIFLTAEVPLSETGFPEAFMHHWRATERRRTAQRAP